MRPQNSEVCRALSSLVPDEACHCASTGDAWSRIEEPRSAPPPHARVYHGSDSWPSPCVSTLWMCLEGDVVLILDET